MMTEECQRKKNKDNTETREKNIMVCGGGQTLYFLFNITLESPPKISHHFFLLLGFCPFENKFGNVKLANAEVHFYIVTYILKPSISNM